MLHKAQLPLHRVHLHALLGEHLRQGHVAGDQQVDAPVLEHGHHLFRAGDRKDIVQPLAAQVFVAVPLPRHRQAAIASGIGQAVDAQGRVLVRVETGARLHQRPDPLEQRFTRGTTDGGKQPDIGQALGLVITAGPGRQFDARTITTAGLQRAHHLDHEAGRLASLAVVQRRILFGVQQQLGRLQRQGQPRTGRQQQTSRQHHCRLLRLRRYRSIPRV